MPAQHELRTAWLTTLTFILAMSLTRSTAAAAPVVIEVARSIRVARLPAGRHRQWASARRTLASRCAGINASCARRRRNVGFNTRRVVRVTYERR